MNINANSRFSQVPHVNVSRSKFEIPHSVKTSFNVGDLIPFYYEEVLPGDTFNVETNMICRMQPLVAPIMDDIYLDFYYFYVPNRIIWKHWKEFMGENTESAWYPSTEYNVPHVQFTENHSPEFGSLADYFGYPIPSEGESLNYSASQLPFRAYCEIWNEWFRDENIQDPILIDKGDSDVVYNGDATYGGVIMKANKYHDYFTSCLPEPQKGPDVTLPLGGVAPIYTADEYDRYVPRAYPLHLTPLGEMPNLGKPYSDITVNMLGELRGSSQGDTPTYTWSEDVGGDGSPGIPVVPDNLYAHLELADNVSINALRMALATQSFYEKNARGGSRYRELITSHFGVTSPDGRQQVPELLNYNRVDVNINQVVQQSESTDTSPLGKQAAYALTADSDNSFMKSFTEHGCVIGVCVARYKHSYQQGLDKRFSRRTMFDYYFPVFANIGEQPVYGKELFAGHGYDDNVFGYQEAYADYRYHPDIVTSEMRSNHPTSLDVWHLADYYEYLPYLSPDWIEEDKTNVDRVLSVTSDVSNQIFCDFYIKNTAVRTMPLYSIPGLPRTL